MSRGGNEAPGAASVLSWARELTRIFVDTVGNKVNFGKPFWPEQLSVRRGTTGLTNSECENFKLVISLRNDALHTPKNTTLPLIVE